MAEPTAKATKNVIPVFYDLWQGDLIQYGLVALPAFTPDAPIEHPGSPIKPGDTIS